MRVNFCTISRRLENHFKDGHVLIPVTWMYLYVAPMPLQTNFIKVFLDGAMNHGYLFKIISSPGSLEEGGKRLRMSRQQCENGSERLKWDKERAIIQATQPATKYVLY